MLKQGGAMSVGNLLPVLGVHSARLAATGWGPQMHGLEDTTSSWAPDEFVFSPQGSEDGDGKEDHEEEDARARKKNDDDDAEHDVGEDEEARQHTGRSGKK